MEIWVAVSGESQLRQGRATQPEVYAGFCSVFISHRTLTWTAGSLTCVQDLFARIGYTHTQVLQFTILSERLCGLQSVHRILTPWKSPTVSTQSLA